VKNDDKELTENKGNVKYDDKEPDENKLNVKNDDRELCGGNAPSGLARV
jgi:hypothetical protein